MILKQKAITINLNKSEWDTELHDIVLSDDPTSPLGFSVKTVPKDAEAIKMADDFLKKIKQR
jgi:hypothetical protein